MTTARELMTEGAECVRTSDTLVTAFAAAWLMLSVAASNSPLPSYAAAIG